MGAQRFVLCFQNIEESLRVVIECGFGEGKRSLIAFFKKKMGEAFFIALHQLRFVDERAQVSNLGQFIPFGKIEHLEVSLAFIELVDGKSHLGLGE